MSGSKKGRKLRPYQTNRVTPVHVLILTPEQIAEDAREHRPTTAELLGMSLIHERKP